MNYYSIRPFVFMRDGKLHSAAHIYQVNMMDEIVAHMHFFECVGAGAVTLSERVMSECYSRNWQNIQFINTEVVARTILMRQLKERVRLKAQEEYEEGQMI